MNYQLNFVPHGKNVFFTEEKIQGTVEVTIHEDVHINAISVKIVGKSSVEIESGKDSQIREERYLGHEIMLYNNQNNSEFKAGNYRYDFEYKLPHNLPPSTRDNEEHKERNNIIYYFKLRISLQKWYLDKVHKYHIIVKRRDDLNCFPILRTPFNKQLVKKYYFGFRKMIMCVSLSQVGYAAGQIMPISIKYENNSGVGVKTTSIKLEEWKLLKANNVTKIEKNTLISLTTNGVDVNSSNEFKYDFKIPNDIYLSDLIWSKSIKIKHYVEIIANVDGMHFSPKIIIPIVIGAVRLNENLKGCHSADHPEIIKHLNKISDQTWFV